jgi:hypothetical protein
MRTPILIATILLVLCLSAQAQQRYKINDAIAKGIVQLKISGTGSHTGRCAIVEAQNTTNQTIDVVIESGQKIQCADSSAQNLVITQTEVVHLTPKKKLLTAVFAMCINASKSSPANKVGFKLGQMAQGALLKLTKFIEKKKYQNGVAQSAVWSITDNKDIASIGSSTDDQYAMINELRGFVATEKHITNYPKAKPLTRTIKEIEGSFDLILQNKANVEVVMVDAQNKVVKQLLKAPKDAGILRINYTIKNTDYKAGTYYIIARAANKEVKREVVVLE